MRIEEIIGKTITNIYTLVTREGGGLDTGECFIELDNKYLIDIPYSFSDKIWLKELNKEAVSLFKDLSDYPVYYVNKGNKTIAEIVKNYQQKRSKIFYRLGEFLFGKGNLIKEYQPYKVDYRENPLKHIKERKIVDFIWFTDDYDKGLFLLDNGYLISETIVAPYGTGLAGLNYFNSIKNLIERRGDKYLKLSDESKGSH